MYNQNKFCVICVLFFITQLFFLQATPPTLTSSCSSDKKTPWTIDWYTTHACEADKLSVANSCKLTGTQYGVDIDLSPLSNSKFILFFDILFLLCQIFYKSISCCLWYNDHMISCLLLSSGRQLQNTTEKVILMFYSDKQWVVLILRFTLGLDNENWPFAKIKI